MPTVRELIATLRRRDGVSAAVVLGPDGLVIAGDADDEIDTERLAAHAPSVVAASTAFGAAAERGELATAILEYDAGLALVTVLSADALLVVLVRAEAEVASVVYDLRRSRAQLAALV